MTRCVIIDDEQASIDVLSRYIDQYPGLDLVGSSADPIPAIEMIRELKPELVFLDIRMNEMTGLELSTEINPSIRVIFCTAYADYAVRSYEVNAVDYLLKPIEFERFSRAVKKAQAFIALDVKPASGADFLLIKGGTRGKRIRIDLAELDYVEALNNYVAFHVSGKKILAHLALKEVEYKLPADDFMRVQKSYIVALNQISSLENNELVLKKTGVRIPISLNYKELFLEKMKEKLM